MIKEIVAKKLSNILSKHSKHTKEIKLKTQRSVQELAKERRRKGGYFMEYRIQDEFDQSYEKKVGFTTLEKYEKTCTFPYYNS